MAHPRVDEATVLRSSLDPADEQYRTNRAAQLALLDQLEEQLELARAGGGPRYQQRHHDRGRLLARERIDEWLRRGEDPRRAAAARELLTDLNADCPE